ncbi:microtubule-actin cross-linking factor 1, isoforms 1/2/3/5-like protein [Camelus ferus]|nr:microtubule-actin cross-linking factor 1, isoforms 1/2/3/5-like protein [Camelus ferus]
MGPPSGPSYVQFLKPGGSLLPGPPGPPAAASAWAMSSSDEETLSERSCRRDTLPWNLPLHEQKKRKSQDSVLDPAERAVVRVAALFSAPEAQPH